MYQEGQGRRLMWGIVSTPEDIANNPHLKARGWLTPVQQNGATLEYPGKPYWLSEAAWAIHRRPPLVGEHNDEIYRGELGLTREQWGDLAAKGAV
jgi:crotonobetainyl-CoA:carnitine CoA-transferase CaiB-like acyl-CoA transferase